MNDWVVETSSFEEDLMNNRVIMLNQNGVNRVIEIIKEKDKEIERLNNIIEELENFISTYAIPEFNLSKEPNRYFMETKIILDKLKELKEKV